MHLGWEPFEAIAVTLNFKRMERPINDRNIRTCFFAPKLFNNQVILSIIVMQSQFIQKGLTNI